MIILGLVLLILGFVAKIVVLWTIGIVVLAVGEFDLTSEGMLTDCLERMRLVRPQRLVFEIAEVAFLDCAAARLIASTASWLPAGVKPVIRCPSPAVRRVLQITTIGSRLEFEYGAQ